MTLPEFELSISLKENTERSPPKTWSFCFVAYTEVLWPVPACLCVRGEGEAKKQQKKRRKSKEERERERIEGGRKRRGVTCLNHVTVPSTSGFECLARRGKRNERTNDTLARVRMCDCVRCVRIRRTRERKIARVEERGQCVG